MVRSAVRIHERGSGSKTRRPFSASTSTSQRLSGETHRSLLGFSSSAATLLVRREGSRRLQRKMWVSSSSFTIGELPRPQPRRLALGCCRRSFSLIVVTPAKTRVFRAAGVVGFARRVPHFERRGRASRFASLWPARRDRSP